MKKMEKEWMKLIDDVENDRRYNTDPIFNFFEFIRENDKYIYIQSAV